MRKSYLFAMCTVVAGSVVSVQAATAKSIQQDKSHANFYGRLSVSLDNSYKNNDKTWHLANQASRIGTRGGLLINTQNEVIYQFEAGINPTSKADEVLSLRNSYIGLQGNWGQVIGGTFDTALKAAQGDVDVFNDTQYDMSAFLPGEVRHGQSVQYRTPSLLGGLTAKVDWLPAQQSENKDGVSVSLRYKADVVDMRLAMDQNVSGDGGVVTTKADRLDIVRAALMFHPADSLVLGVLGQSSEGRDGNQSRERGWLVSAAWSADKITLKAQVGQGKASREASGASSYEKIGQASVGVNYHFSKQMQTFAYAGVQKRDGGSATSTSEPGVGIGMRLDF